MFGSKASSTKSRKGCSACKRKRVKCDELKPTCTRCLKARTAEPCDYNLKLSWTQGRPFKKRRLGSETTLSHDEAAGEYVRSPDGPNLQNVPDRDGLMGTFQDVFSAADVLVSKGSGQRSNAVSGLPGGASAAGFAVGVDNSSSLAKSPSPSPSQFEDAPDDDSLKQVARLDSPKTGPLVNLDPADDAEYTIVRSQHGQSPAIPPSLSSYPLLCPSESPNAYFFLHHYSVHTATTLFPLLPSASRDSLLSVAASCPHLLSALLAISANQYCLLKKDLSPDSKSRALFFSRKALVGLQAAMKDPLQATTFPTISTVLALCTNDVLMSGNVQGWKTHLRGAEQLLTLAIGKSRDIVVVTDPSKLFLIKWFAALDMFAGISSLEKTLVPDGRYWSIGFSSDGSTQYVDDFVGFSLELMPLLSRISSMARLQQRKSALASSLGSDYTELADDLESLLYDNVQHTEQQLIALLWRVSSPSIVDATAAEEAQQTHQLFVYAALLHLYRRVQELPKDHHKPEQATLMIIDISTRLPADSPASIVILWPLFSAGCETNDAARRQIIRDRMESLRRNGMGNVDQALAAMQEYWDSDTSERWDVWLGRHGVDLVLF